MTDDENKKNEKMRNTIIITLCTLGKLGLKSNSNLSERVIGEKDDVVTKGDLEIGKKMIAYLTAMQPSKIVESEEFGKKYSLSGQIAEDFYVAIDDIDGTNNFRMGMEMSPYCSMIVAFDGNKKTADGHYKYSAYTHAACIEYTTGKIYYTEKGLGRVEQYDLNEVKLADSTQMKKDNKGLVFTLGVDNVSTYRGGTVGYASNGTALSVSSDASELDSVYRNFATVDSGCSVYEYAKVGMGAVDGYVAKGKKQHELPLLYAFCKETGKQMVDFNGIPYDDKVYDFHGKGAEVVAGESNVVEKVLTCIKLQKEYMNKAKSASVSSITRSTII